MSGNTFICTILFDLIESPKIILFKDLADKIIEAEVAENVFFFMLFSVNLTSIISKSYLKRF